MKKPMILLLLPLVLCSCSGTETKAEFANWNVECDAIKTLTSFVEKADRKGESTYIPVKDRLAVFDMDGTLFGELFPTYLEYTMFVYRALEDPSYAPTCPEDVKAVAEEIKAGSPTHSYASDMAIRHGKAAAKAYAGMTIKEFASYAITFLGREVPGFTGMTYAEAVYKPMIDVVDYLHKNDYDVYVVSGSDRFLCREIVRDAFKIPDNHVIGMDVTLVTSELGDTDPVDYTFAQDDTLIRGDELLIKNLKFNKVTAIAKEIGKQPVLSFGNSGGDSAMHNYTLTGNPYQSAAFMLVADDGERDNGGSKNDPLHKKWQDMGYHTVSMKNDFKTIYGDNVKKK